MDDKRRVENMVPERGGEGNNIQQDIGKTGNRRASMDEQKKRQRTLEKNRRTEGTRGG